MLQGKRVKSQKWLPSQVAYGMDTSDPDPSKWQPFGELHEQAVEAAKHSAPKVAGAATPQSAPKGP